MFEDDGPIAQAERRVSYPHQAIKGGFAAFKVEEYSVAPGHTLTRGLANEP